MGAPFVFWRRRLADRSVRPTQKLGGLVGSDGHWRVLGSGPGVAHAVDYGDGA